MTAQKQPTIKTRAEIHSEAKRLIRGGVSRRRLDTILRERFGVSIGKSTYSRFYRERVEAVEQSMEAKAPTGYQKPRTRRTRIYTQLVQSNFLPWEARELASRLHSTKRIHELKFMTAERERLRNRFLRYATRTGIPSSELRRAWEDYVRKWYGDTAIRWQKQWERDQIRKGKRVLKRRTKEDLLWKWFGHTKKDLPPDIQYKSPPHGGRKQQPKLSLTNRERIRISGWIKDLQAKIDDPATTPERKKQLREQASQLRKQLQ